MNSNEIRQAWENKGKKVLYGGNFTKGFIKFNNQLLKENKTDYVAYDPNKLFNRTTGRIVNKDVYYTKKGKLRAKYNNNEFVANNDSFIQPSRFIQNNYKKDIDRFTKSNDMNEIEIDLESINYDLSYLLKFIKPRLDQNIYINVGDIWYTLNMNTIKNINTAIIEEDTSGDYGQLVQIMRVMDKAKLVFKLADKKKVNGGAFFPYTHKLTKFNFDKYGVFSTIDKKNYEQNCLCDCFKAAGLDFTAIKCMVRNQEIPMRKLGEVAQKLGVYITVRKIEDKKNLKHYGDKNNPKLEIGLINKHYFIIEKTEYTSYSIKNYFDICDIEGFNNICGKRGNGYIKRKDKYITSYDCIRLMLEHGSTHLKPIELCNDIYASLHYGKISDEIFTDLSYNENVYDPNPAYGEACLEGNLKKNQYRKYKPDDELVETYFFDFETSTCSEKKYNHKKDNNNPYHTPYCVFTDKHRQGFYGTECGKYLLEDILKKHGVAVEKGDDVDNPAQKGINKVRMIAHNAGYDWRFISPYLTRINTIEKGTGLMWGEGFYYNFGKVVKIEVKDSIKMINMPLRKFGKTFNLKTKKEIMPYNLYSEENVKETYIDINECLKHVEKHNHKEYLANCDKWDCINDNKINIIKYAGEYCYMDCIVLRDGYNKFAELVKEAIDEDITNYISLASMADNYLKKQDCYKGCLMLSGTPRHFIQKCVVGGRTMVSNNHKSRNLKSSTYSKYGIKDFDKYSHKDRIISDFDAVSLYPSAMARMTGFLKGAPKIIHDFNEVRNFADGYFICCRVKKVGKKYNFPCASLITENGIRDYTNDLVGKVIYLDKIGLEDFENFQQGEVEFINGYYYNKGFNNNINETMKYLFQQRLKYKKLGNPIQMVFKELMNSSYGKASLKAIETDNIYIDKDNFFDYMDRNYNYIKEAVELPSGNFKIKVASTIDTHFNNVPQGVSILSWSKRIMYEVMTLAEDNNYPMYITDTDSLHIDTDCVEKLGEKFMQKYGRELIGEQMGQFHTDFDMDGAADEIVAIESIFLGKKAYIDKLESKDKKGNIIHDYHIRLKGVPCDCIIDKANKEYGGDLMKLYNDLYEGKEIVFNLLAVRPKFEVCKNMQIIHKTKFNRKVKF